MPGGIDFLEIDISPLNICFDQLYTYPVANIHIAKPLDQFAFNRQAEKPYPGAFLGSACDNRIELLTDSCFEQQCSRGFLDLAFDFVGGIFSGGAMSCQNIQPIFTVWR